MYGLIKGRESIRAKGRAGDRGGEADAVAEPIQPWVPPTPAERPWVERFGPAVGVLALILGLALAAWGTLEPPETSPRFRSRVASEKEGALKKVPGPVAQNAAPAPPAAPGGAAPKETPPGQPAAEAAKAAEAVAAKGAGTDVPKVTDISKAEPRSDALAKKPDGVLLLYNPARRDWVRITEATTLHEQDRVLNLAPFRSTLEVGQSSVDLVGETEVWVRSTPKTQAARLTLSRGRLVLHGTDSSLPFEVQLDGKTVTLSVPPGIPVGLERVSRREPGAPTAVAPALTVYASDGPVTVTSPGGEETLKGVGALAVAGDGRPTVSSSQPTPAWVTETSLPQFDRNVGEKFLQFFRDNRPILSGLVEASEDENRDVCRLAISALKAVDDVSDVVPLLKRQGTPNAPAVRRAAVAVLRSYIAEGPDALKTLRPHLQRDLGPERAATTEKLLLGYTAKEAGDDATYFKLVQYLDLRDESEVGVRELALDNLEQLTGRDDLGYDPENPAANGGKGLKAWRDLQRNNELKPAARGEPR
jgi:hypothetical protein